MAWNVASVCGAAVAASTSFPIGTRTGSGLITRSGARQLQLLPDGRVLFAMGDSTTPVAALAVASLAVVLGGLVACGGAPGVGCRC